MSWSYRLIKGKNKKSNEEFISVAEVYYDKHNIPIGWSFDAPIHGGTLEDIKIDLKYHNDAFNKPILELKVDENENEYLKEGE